MVRMAQDFSMRVPLVDGQGNFGSVDGDPPAAYRYTEARLTRSALAVLGDIDKDTVDFQGNYDNSEKEPSVLPAKFPTLLVNGAGAIAAVMATNIPPHNLGEVIDACGALIDDPALGIDELINITPGPDFPTGGIILGRQGIRSAYHLGRGSIVMRGKVSIDTIRKDREAIIVTEIPYQVNKATMVERIAELVKEKKIDGIADLRDESDRDGFRVVIELKRDAVPDVVLNQLYRFTPLKKSFGVNMVALDSGRPRIMTLKDLLDILDDFCEWVVTLAGEIADYLDILRSRARVLDIVKTELAEVKAEFATPRRTVIIEQEGEVEDEDLIQREEMVVTVSHAGYVKRVPLSAYRAQRRGGKGRAGMQTRDEDFVSRLFVASTHTPMLFFSSRGQVYKVKVWRLPMAAPNARGKALINILPLEQGERITTIMPLPEDESTWGNLDVMFATTGGNVRRNKLSDFVDVRRSGIIAMKLDPDEAIVDVQICTERDDVLLTGAGGQCIRFPVTDVRVFTGRTSMGVRGIALAENDKVISLTILRHLDANAEERAAYLRRANAVRRGGVEEEAGIDTEDASGTMELGEQRYVEMSASEQFVLTISENGYGKRSSSFEYRTTGRGGKGIVAMSVNERNGKLVASFPVEDSDQIMLVTDKGQLIRCPVEGIRIAGRSTQGVIVFDTAEDEHVVSVEHIGEEENGNGG